MQLKTSCYNQCLMSNRRFTHDQHVLEFLCYDSMINCAICFYIYNQSAPYIVVETSSCFLTHFLISIVCIPHSLQVYIAVDTILYLYTLPIDFIPHSYLSLCLSCNLSQAKGYNTSIVQFLLHPSITSFLLNLYYQQHQSCYNLSLSNRMKDNSYIKQYKRT